MVYLFGKLSFHGFQAGVDLEVSCKYNLKGMFSKNKKEKIIFRFYPVFPVVGR